MQVANKSNDLDMLSLRHCHDRGETASSYLLVSGFFIFSRGFSEAESGFFTFFKFLQFRLYDWKHFKKRDHVSNRSTALLSGSGTRFSAL